RDCYEKKLIEVIKIHTDSNVADLLTKGFDVTRFNLLVWKILQTLTNGAKRKLDHLLLHLVNGLLWKTNDESGTPRSQSGWKTSWAKKDDKEDQCASRVEDSSNTNQWGKKEAGSSPSSSGKWAAVEFFF
ncbi:hypothetical protein Tco_1336618, partial [Tanacetum coccineum]